MQPERIRYARSADGTQIAWAVSGEGPRTLVMAANSVTNIRRDWESPIRRGGLAALSQHFRVIRYDHRGFGSSQRGVERQGLEAWVEDLAAVVEAAGLEKRFILLGKSQAGPCSIAYAAQNPDRVSHLVLYGAARRSLREYGNALQIAQHEAMLELVRTGWGDSFPGPRRLVASYLILDPTEEEQNWHEKESLTAATAADAYRFFQANGYASAAGWAPKVRTASLVINASEDCLSLPEYGRLTAAAIPGAQYLEIPGRNHILLTRDPGFPVFMSELLAFTAEPARDDPLAQLSPRELDILEGVFAGLSNEAIALQRDISAKTVRNHLTRIFDKLRVSSRTQAALKYGAAKRAG